MVTRPGFERLALFAVAFVLRASFPEGCFFGTDQVGTLLNGRAVLAGDWFVPGPGIGWSSVSLGPLFNQVAAVAFLARDRFEDLVVLLAALHAFAVAASPSYLGRLFGRQEGRLGAWFLATLPASVAMGASPISSALVLPTTLLFAWGARTWADDRNPRGFAAASIGAALMVQAHVTTLLLLPMVLVGLRRRAPVEPVGLLGFGVGLALFYPTLSQTLTQALEHPEGLHHASGSGAPFVVALGRALALDWVVAVLPSHGATWGASVAPGLALGLSAATAVGAVVAYARFPTARPYLVLGLFLPTVVVALVPRGSLHYYLESTVALRAGALGVATRVAMAHAERRLPRFGATLVAVLALGVPSALGVHLAVARSQAASRGYVAIHFGRSDLRQPQGAPDTAYAVPTLSAQRLLGSALARYGASRDSLPLRLHGPWRWMLANSSWAFADASPRVPARDVWVRHADDAQPARALGSRPLEAGRFAVGSFRNRARVEPDGDGQSVRVVVDAGAPFALRIVPPAGMSMTACTSSHGPCEHRVTQSVAGFPEYHLHGAGGASPSGFRVRFASAGNGSPLVRSDVDAYAYDEEPMAVR